jgi:hypothetical protein
MAAARRRPLRVLAAPAAQPVAPGAAEPVPLVAEQPPAIQVPDVQLVGPQQNPVPRNLYQRLADADAAHAIFNRVHTAVYVPKVDAFFNWLFPGY